MVWIDQLLPFHRSANTPVPEPFSYHPTVVQAVLDVHDTPPRALAVPGVGMVWIDQLVPFQRSATATCGLESPSVAPTAVQAVLDVHDTLPRPPPALGMVWTDQLVPFHRSATGA